MAQVNPAHPESEAIALAMTSVHVTYHTLDGKDATGIIETHPLVKDDIIAFFEEAYRINFPIEQVTPSSEYNWDDDVLMDKNVTSSFNYRLIKGTTTPSLHGQGLAIDINPRFNPYIRFVEGREEVDPPGALLDPSIPGTLTYDHPLVSFMKERGWEWGGDWTKEYGCIDYQHFQKKLPT